MDAQFLALLIGGIPGRDGQSMVRYNRELREALRSVAGAKWQIEEVTANPSYIAENLPGDLGSRIGTALVRYVKYPIQASRLKADVFHIIDHSYAHLLLPLDPRRTIVTCHDLIPLLSKRGDLRMRMSAHVGWTFRCRMLLMRRAAFVITDSESTRRDVLRFLNLDSERVIVIPVGLSTIFRPTREAESLERTRREFGIPQKCKIVLTVSSASEYKNIAAILRAVDIIRRESTTDVRFLRVGGDFSIEEKRLVEQLGLDSSVQHIGSIEGDEELARLYQLSDVFVFPSLYEGFGWPPLEAMACGIPVIASNAGSLPEVLGNAAILVEPRDTRKLAAAIGSLLEHSSFCDEMIERGLRQAARYTWDRTSLKTRDVYERVIRQSQLAEKKKAV